MVLELRIKNFRSIKNEMILDLRAADIKTEKAKSLKNNIFKFDDIHVLKTIGIYGANASGKSNVLKAIDFLVGMIKFSGTHNGVDDLIISPFKFDGCSLKPTEFGIVFAVEDVEYDYSFSADKDGVIEEALYHYPNNKKAKIFKRNERADSPKTDKYSYGRGKIVKPADVTTSTHSKTLFLSRAALMNREIPKKIYTYFIEDFITRLDIEPHEQNLKYIQANKALLLDILKIADSDIVDFKIKLVKEATTSINADFEKRHAVFKDGEQSKFEIVSYHKTNPNIPFNFAYEESSGTIRMFDLMIAFIDIIRRNKIIIIDEIERHLHPLIVLFIIRTFHGPGKGQMIFTTHQTSILDLTRMRRDQIWFANKRTDSSTDLYSLYDFKDFRENMNLEKAYFQGRFDSIPIVDESDQSMDSIIPDNGPAKKTKKKPNN